MMDGFMQLVKDMRAAQKHLPDIPLDMTPNNVGVVLSDYIKRSTDYYNNLRALERRVNEEIAAAERQDQTTDPDCIRMANGQILRQGNLFEDQ